MSDMIYRPLIEDMTWSYSRIECFNSCRYKFFLRYIKRLPEEEMFYASYGSFMHKLIEQFCKGKLTKEDMLIKYMFYYQKMVKGERPAGNIAQTYMQKGIEYIQNIQPFPYNVVAVEKEFRFNIGNRPFVGYVDFLGEKDGDYYIIDNKSRDLRPRSNRKIPTRKDEELDDMLRQLYIYSAAVKQEYGKYPKSLCFNCFKSGVFIEEPFIEDVFDKTMEWVESSISSIEDEEDFYPSPDYFGCEFICGLKNECEYYEMR